VSAHDADRGERLACGRPAGELLDQVADGGAQPRDAHQRGCVHCQAALAEYDRLWSPVRELAAERVDVPDSVMDAALRRIRGAVERPDYAVLQGPRGRTRIAARVVVAAARDAAQAVPGVRVAVGRQLGGSGGGAAADVAVGVAGRSAAVEIVLAASYGVDLVALGERVRSEVAARIRQLTDLEPVDVTVIIDDILD
jgi:uncharacterized alkaline shock family protein YloU